jgi:hypothetical protein
MTKKVNVKAYMCKPEEDMASVEIDLQFTISNTKIPLEDIVSELAYEKSKELHPNLEFVDHEITDIQIVK